MKRFNWICKKEDAAEDTDGYIGVFVQDDLKQVRWEYRRGFKVLFRSEAVLLLAIWSWRGAGQVCEDTTVFITQLIQDSCPLITV